ncbi:MAG: 4-hydroxy-tetrahydrodipicolinate reductase [Phycisphaerae bacterium]|nr:4-hydroxy-tetrahydrodipicolinate reductase [Phycisphaerae bacterium]
MLKLGVTGAAGRMGRRIVAMGTESGNFEITAGMEFSGCELMGKDVGQLAGLGPMGVPVTEKPENPVDVIIDFSLPDGSKQWVEYCSENNIPLVVGTTGLSEAQRQELIDAGAKIPVLLGANMSLGVNLLFKLAAQVAGALDDQYDIEVVESHHRFKRDAPSGTAVELARQMAIAKDWGFPDCMTHGREGKDALREPKTIGMHAVRAGDIVGEHEIYFSALGETITLKHRAHSRDTFVTGALTAAKWLVKQKPGFYTMFDVLGL